MSFFYLAAGTVVEFYAASVQILMFQSSNLD